MATGTMGDSLRLTQASLAGLVFDESKGPFEAVPHVVDKDSAQTWYYQTREITIYDPWPKKDFATTYQLQFPEKPIPEVEGVPRPPVTGAPFDGTTTYTDHYPPKEAPVAGVPNELPKWEPAPMIDKTTIHTEKYPDPEQVQPGPPPDTRPAAPINPDDLYSQVDIPTYRDHFPPKSSIIDKGPPADRGWEPTPSRVHTTTHNHFFVPKDLPEKVPLEEGVPPTVPFLGDTTHRAEYPPKEAPPAEPLATPIGIKVPHPRMDLGVEKVIVDGYKTIEDDVFHVLIPAIAAPPTMGRQVFTTVHDNQTQVSILVFHGFDYNASKNDLLGQFDIINIPPMGRYIPKIEVTFFLDKHDILTAEARELDANNHKAWREAGGAIVLRQ